MKGLNVQAHVSYSQRDIAENILKMAKPDIDTCRDYIWKIIVEKQFTVDENEKSNNANQAEKAKILQQMEDLLKVNEKVGDVDLCMSVLDSIFTTNSWNRWDMVVELLMKMCTPREDSSEAITIESPQGKLLLNSKGQPKTINLENYLDLNFIDPKKWSLFKKSFALGEQITPRIKLVAFTSPLIKGGSDEYIGEVEIPVSMITGLGGLIDDRWTPMWNHSNLRVGEVRLKASFEVGQKIRQSIHIKPKKNMKKKMFGALKAMSISKRKIKIFFFFFNSKFLTVY